MKPCEANTIKKVCSLKIDNCESRNAWILVDSKYVTLHNQKRGEESTGEVHLTYAEMTKFAKWFLGIK